MRSLKLTLALLAAAQTANAAPLTPADESDARTLEANVQAVKKETSQLAADLQKLQSALLTPASTRVTVFLSVDNQAGYTPESVQLMIDNQLVQSWLYTPREQEALKKGGIQQLYLGNLPLGEHKLNVTVQSSDGAKGVTSYNLSKELSSKYMELKVSGTSQQPAIKVKEWE